MTGAAQKQRAKGTRSVEAFEHIFKDVEHAKSKSCVKFECSLLVRQARAQRDQKALGRLDTFGSVAQTVVNLSMSHARLMPPPVKVSSFERVLSFFLAHTRPLERLTTICAIAIRKPGKGGSS